MPYRPLVIVLLSIASLVVWSRPADAQAPTENFPPGKGRDILEASCTTCHDLDEVTKLRGKVTADGWRAIVKTMTEYGAQVDPKDVSVLVEYLDRNFGKQR